MDFNLNYFNFSLRKEVEIIVNFFANFLITGFITEPIVKLLKLSLLIIVTFKKFIIEHSDSIVDFPS